MRRIYIVFVMVIVFTTSGCTMNTYRTSEISEYGSYKSTIIYDYLESFPDKEVVNKSINCNYEYRYRGTLFYDDQCIYIWCEYSEEDYISEIERLNISHGEYDTVLFDLPAYVFIYDDICYEYAIIDDENRTIHYIYIQYLTDLCEDAGIPYLPQKSADIYVY
ncbi:MAG: hypothetical protein IJZ94_05380 [Clostridia bacterium]|nr:hypothetical protein [Clostridia bacterium]